MNLLGFCAKIKVENQMGFSAGGSFWAKTKVGFLSWKNSRCCCMMGTEQQRCQRERSWLQVEAKSNTCNYSSFALLFSPRLTFSALPELCGGWLFWPSRKTAIFSHSDSSEPIKPSTSCCWLLFLWLVKYMPLERKKMVFRVKIVKAYSM